MMADAWVVFIKEVRLELRTRESLAAMVVFSAGVIVLFALAVNAPVARSGSITPGLMWMTYFFAAVLGLLRSFGREKEMEAFTLLLSAPVDRGGIYLGKMLALCLFLVVAQLASLPLFTLFLALPVGNAPAYLALILLVTDLAIAAVGTLIAALGLRSPAGEILLPILLFPLLAPILIAATKATTLALDARPLSEWG